MTVAHDAIPRRRPRPWPTTRSSRPSAEPARGGPADRRGSTDAADAGRGVRIVERPFAPATAADRVRRRPSRGVAGPRRRRRATRSSGPVRRSRWTARSPAALAEPALTPARPVDRDARPVADPMSTALPATAPRPRVAAARRADAPRPRPIDGDRAARRRRRSAHADRGRRPAAPGAAPTAGRRRGAVAAADPAAVPATAAPSERRIADERCELATRARARRDAAADDALRAAQRAYDEHESPRPTAAAAAPTRAPSARRRRRPRRGFRAAASGGRDDRRRRGGGARLAAPRSTGSTPRPARPRPRPTRERAAARRRSARRSSGSALEADAARIAAETAEAACLAAREAVADCDERADAERPTRRQLARRRRRAAGARPSRTTSRWPPRSRPAATPRIFRLAARRPRGDDRARRRAGRRRRRRARGTGSSPSAELVDAIVADAIEACALDFPADHAVLGPVHPDPGPRHRRAPCRRSATGSTGSAAGSTTACPSQRDLSLALGYAGPRPDADPALADRGRDGRPVPRGRRSPPTSTWPARPADLTLGEMVDACSAGAPTAWPRSGTSGAGSGRCCLERGAVELGRSPASAPGPSSSSSSMTISRSASAAADPDRRALLGAPTSRIRSAEPRRARGSGCACARSAAILRSSVAETSTQAFGSVRPEEVEPADARGRPGRRGPATGTPSGCGPPGRPRRRRPCPAARWSVWLTPPSPVEERLRVGGEDRVGPERPDLADEHARAGRGRWRGRRRAGGGRSRPA